MQLCHLQWYHTGKIYHFLWVIKYLTFMFHHLLFALVTISAKLFCSKLFSIHNSSFPIYTPLHTRQTCKTIFNISPFARAPIAIDVHAFLAINTGCCCVYVSADNSSNIAIIVCKVNSVVWLKKYKIHWNLGYIQRHLNNQKFELVFFFLLACIAMICTFIFTSGPILYFMGNVLSCNSHYITASYEMFDQTSR